MGVIVIYGAGSTGKRIANMTKGEIIIDYFVDTDVAKKGLFISGIETISYEDMLDKDIDRIIIGTLSSPIELVEKLKHDGIDSSKIDFSYIEIPIKARNIFLKNFALVVDKYHLDGEVAEAGVYRGDFAREINKYFPNKKLYLFDTFEGFDARDIEKEIKNNFSVAKEKDLCTTSEQIVMNNMSSPSKCIIKKGYFPESARGIEEIFCFVNLDMDLYLPTKEGLIFFYPQMVTGGIILIHDYFNDAYLGVREAVDEWCMANNVVPFSIGDGISIAVQKK